MNILHKLKRILVGVVRLPRIMDDVHNAKVVNDNLQKDRDTSHKKLDELNKSLNEINTQIASVDKRLTNTVSTIGNMQPKESLSEGGGGRFADNHLLDSFYVDFEDKFRGTEGDIKEKVKIYPPFFKKLEIDFEKNPVIDIGSGRGELLSSFSKQNINAIGVDINHSMVERAKKNGFEAVQADALEFLSKQKSESVGGITGMHIVEHIPFAELLKMFQECYRVLVPGGAVAFETPNPENLMVGTHNFYMDPSHLNPLPPPLLEFAIKNAGFAHTEVWRLNPLKETLKKESHENELLDELSERLYGALDYSVIGIKPKYEK